MFSNQVLITKNARGNIVFLVRFHYKGVTRSQDDARGFTGYGIDSITEKVQISRHDVITRFGEPQYDAVIEKLLTIRAMLMMCKEPLFGDASIFEATWGELPINVTSAHRSVIREMLKDSK